MCGPFAVLMSYLTEFHGTEYRPRIMMLIGIMFSTASIGLPVLALFILPQSWDFQIFNMNCKYARIRMKNYQSKYYQPNGLRQH